MKIWAYIILAGMIIGAIGGAWKVTYAAGYNARDSELRDDAISAQNAAIDKGIADWIATQAEAEATIIVEEKIVEKIREVEKKIPIVVEKIVEIKPECSDLGDDFAGLLNDQVRASNSDKGGSADATDDMVEGVSGTP